MRLTEIELRNFKAFQHARISIAPLTILIGRNNAGKSTVLQAAALVQQSAALRDPDVRSDGPAVDLGRDPRALKNSRSREAWRIGLTYCDPCRLDEHAEAVPSVRFECSPGDKQDKASSDFRVQVPRPDGVGVVTVSGGFPGSEVAEATVKPGVDEGAGPLAWRYRLPSRGLWAYAMESEPTYASQFLKRMDAMEIAGQPASNPARAIGECVSRLVEGINPAIRAFRYIGADRFVERSVYQLGNAAVENPRTASEVVDTLSYESETLQRVSGTLEKMFGYSLHTQLLPGKQVELVASPRGDGGRGISLVNLGSGFVQMVWLLLQLELAGRDVDVSGLGITPTVGLEEPELHLHPRAQDDVARIIVEYAKAGPQILCTIQSEHLLTAILQRVLDGTLDHRNLAVYYIEDGQATSLEVDEAGRLSQGLRGFFEANEEQLQRHIDLLLKNA